MVLPEIKFWDDVNQPTKNYCEYAADSKNWLALYKHFLLNGFEVRLKIKTIDGIQKYSIIYWESKVA